MAMTANIGVADEEDVDWTALGPTFDAFMHFWMSFAAWGVMKVDDDDEDMIWFSLVSVDYSFLDFEKKEQHWIATINEKLVKSC